MGTLKLIQARIVVVGKTCYPKQSPTITLSDNRVTHFPFRGMFNHLISLGVLVPLVKRLLWLLSAIEIPVP